MNYSVVSYISLAAAAAALGGALGAYWATVKRPKQNLPTQLAEVLLGVLAASGVVDEYIGHTSIPFAGLVGASVGAASGFVLDTAAELLPTAARKGGKILLELLPNILKDTLNFWANKIGKKK